MPTCQNPEIHTRPKPNAIRSSERLCPPARTQKSTRHQNQMRYVPCIRAFRITICRQKGKDLTHTAAEARSQANLQLPRTHKEQAFSHGVDNCCKFGNREKRSHSLFLFQQYYYNLNSNTNQSFSIFNTTTRIIFDVSPLPTVNEEVPAPVLPSTNAYRHFFLQRKVPSIINTSAIPCHGK